MIGLWRISLSDARTRTPKPVADRRDVRSAPLSPADGFVLSRVDGLATEWDIVATTGLPDDQVHASLAKLESLALIVFDAPVRTSGALGTADANAGTRPRADPSSPTAVDATDAAAPVDPSLTPEERVALGEDVDLDVATRQRVLVMHRGLDGLDHYALLGVEKSVDRKSLKRAYFELAAKFHPDRYFRKKLGSYKPRMEAIFGRITQAHDTLTSKAARAEYDAYLDEQRRARSIEDLLADALAEVSRAAESIEREAIGPEASVSASSAPMGAPTSVPSTSRPVDPALRREALARRLLAGRGASSSTSPPRAATPSTPSAPSTVDAMASLRRRYDERRSMAQASQAKKYVTNAEAALAAGDPVAATNAFRVAMTLTPDDADLARRAMEAQSQSDAILAETYTKQAGYEEKNGRWSDAARSWARVCKGRPEDGPAHERGANALVQAGGDLHEASRLAQRACALVPSSAAFRATLANVYLAAGLMRNARRELETAAQLAPHDGTIQAMLERLGKSA
jgi:tetratricopeptide (TPR) repeat protein